MKIINPVHWRIEHRDGNSHAAPLVSLINDRAHRFHVHPIDARLVRIVHSLPPSEQGGCGALGGVAMRNDQQAKSLLDGIHWERRTKAWEVNADEQRKRVVMSSTQGGIRIELDYTHTITLHWYWCASGEQRTAFLRDFKSAYQYDARTKRVWHLVERDQSYVPLSEHARPANDNHIPQPGRYEFVYGLGESKGPMMKDGKRYIIEARDSLAADPQDTDPLYKICPFYMHYNAQTDVWFGLYYNTLVPSVFDFSGEHDFATGQFRSFSAERGPLDYYVLLGSPDDGMLSSSSSSSSLAKPHPSNIVTQLAKIVTPNCFGPAGHRMASSNTQSRDQGWQASPTLPPHNQFGYLASSMTLSERADAQTAVVEYVQTAREHGFPIDSMHLSSGYCVDAKTGERKYFYWDHDKYPDPQALGTLLERKLHCTVIINVKPWLLETHPWYAQTAQAGAFVRAAPEACRDADEDRCHSELVTVPPPSRTIHWARGMGDTGKGSYIDFSSRAGANAWSRFIRTGVLANGITGIWDDNNEFSSTIDDEDELAGELDLWRVPHISSSSADTEQMQTQSDDNNDVVAARFGWGHRSIAIGAVGQATQTMGMARATFATLLESQPNRRPVVVTRSAVPGIQAFAHSTWSGDNSTTWLSLRWSTKLSMSIALSFGLGLYGHDIGGFAGAHSPSPELLVRWCQQSMWMTRFTIHSWKAISTTPWMYDDHVGFGSDGTRTITDVLRDVVLFRYRLLPTLYSLYVTQYHRRGWPVVRPLLWHHGRHVECLTQDEQFLVGSHILVSPVCEAGVTHATFFLPHLLDAAVDGTGAADDSCWFELDTGRTHRPSSEGNMLTINAPLDRCPTLVREGGMYVVGPPLTSHIPSPASAHQVYEARIFPCPRDVLRQRSSIAEAKASAISTGSFTLFEDDGTTNDATRHGTFTEITLHFSTHGGSDTVDVSVQVLIGAKPGRWDISFVLPPGDTRRIRAIRTAAHALDARADVTVSGPAVVTIVVVDDNKKHTGV